MAYYTLGSVKKKRPAKLVSSSKQPAIRYVERIPEELRFIRRFVNLDGKAKTKEQVLSLINSLQRAIVERRIRKTSPFAREIDYIQQTLIEVYNFRFTGNTYKFKIQPAKLNALLAMVNSEKVMPSVSYLKKGIGVSGKPGMKLRAKNLLNTVKKSDPG
jgi:DNA polymerase/3'-5' exonuclease PolX